MTISSVKTGAIGDSLLAGNAAFIPTSFESIATATGTGSESTITFSSIPQTYQHLQIRCLAKDADTSGTATVDYGGIIINSDFGSNYRWHRLNGNGTSATATAAASATTRARGFAMPYGDTTSYGVSIIDIHDYASTTKNKTIRTFAGGDLNSGTTTSNLILASSLWMDTSAITSISLERIASTFASGSVISLYGIKA